MRATTHSTITWPGFQHGFSPLMLTPTRATFFFSCLSSMKFSKNTGQINISTAMLLYWSKNSFLTILRFLLPQTTFELVPEPCQENMECASSVHDEARLAQTVTAGFLLVYTSMKLYAIGGLHKHCSAIVSCLRTTAPSSCTVTSMVTEHALAVNRRAKRTWRHTRTCASIVVRRQ